MNLILVRHGETEWNKLGLCQGVSDIGLSEEGKRQADVLGISLKHVDIDYIYSSDLKRAYDTAAAIAKYQNIEVIIDPGFREMDQGEFEGLPFTQLRESHSELLQSWRNNPANFRIPRGETLQEVQDRAYESVNRIINKHFNKSVLVVSHNFTIITLLCKFRGKSLKDFYKFKIKETSKHIIKIDNDDNKVELYNNTEHLNSIN